MSPSPRPHALSKGFFFGNTPRTFRNKKEEPILVLFDGILFLHDLDQLLLPLLLSRPLQKEVEHWDSLFCIELLSQVELLAI